METVILKKKPHPLVTCMTIVFALVLVFVAAVLWLVAATGIMAIPIFSRLAYETPTPLRTVTPGVPLETYIQSEVSEILTRRLYEGQGSLQDTSLEMRLTEQSFTASLRGLTQEIGEGLPFDFSAAQVALDAQKGAEIFLPIKENPQQTAVRICVYASAQDGAVSLEIKEASVGALDVPMSVFNSLLHRVVEQSLRSLYEQLGSYVSLHSITYEDGVMILSGDLAVTFETQE
jgi:hypothetical protein